MKRADLFHYTQCGLDDVWLRNGYETEETEYGPGFKIDRADDLHRAIARSIVNDNRPLRGQEVRFLRVMLHLSQEHMAKLLGIDRATIIRWEKARDKTLNVMQDIAVRTTYASRIDGASFVLSVIKELQEADERDHGDAYRAVFETDNRGWQNKTAA